MTKEDDLKLMAKTLFIQLTDPKRNLSKSDVDEIIYYLDQENFYKKW